MAKSYSVNILNEAEGITDATPINTIITVVGFIGLAVGVLASNLYFTGSLWG